MSHPSFSISQVNEFTARQFVDVLGPMFEHSPWIAADSYTKRPFANLEELHQALCQTVRNADEGKKLSLILAHPDLVGRAALAGTLTAASTKEQASAGLNRLTPEEITLFQKNNQA